MDSAGCVTAQALAALPKCPWCDSADKYRNCFNVIIPIRYSYRSAQAIELDLSERRIFTSQGGTDVRGPKTLSGEKHGRKD